MFSSIRMLQYLAIMIALLAFSRSRSYADYVVTIGNGTGINAPWASVDAVTGGKVSIPIFLQMNSPTTDFSIAFDFGSDPSGYGMPVGYSTPKVITQHADPFSGFSAVGINDELPGQLHSIPGLSEQINWDFAVNLTRDLAVTFSTPTRVFDLEFTVQPNAQPGTQLLSGVPIPFGFPQATSFSNGGGPTDGTVTFYNGSITAAPEPSSLALLGLIAAGGTAYRRFRKKATKVNEQEAA